jgi:threonine dehydratase
VSEDAARDAMRVLWQSTHQMPEPAGAIALAGLLADAGREAGARTAVVMTGGNCDAALVRTVVAGS